MYETRGIFFYIGSLLFLHVFSSNFQFLKVFGSERSNSAVKSSLRIEQRGPISEKKCLNFMAKNLGHTFRWAIYFLFHMTIIIPKLTSINWRAHLSQKLTHIKEACSFPKWYHTNFRFNVREATFKEIEVLTKTIGYFF